MLLPAAVWLGFVELSSTPSIGVMETELDRFVRLQAHLNLVFKQPPSQSCSRSLFAAPGPAIVGPAVVGPAIAGLSKLLVDLPNVVLSRESSSTPPALVFLSVKSTAMASCGHRSDGLVRPGRLPEAPARPAKNGPPKALDRRS